MTIRSPTPSIASKQCVFMLHPHCISTDPSQLKKLQELPEYLALVEKFTTSEIMPWADVESVFASILRSTDGLADCHSHGAFFDRDISL